MKLKDLERKDHLYYGTSYSNYKELEKILLEGIPQDNYGMKWNNKEVLPFLHKADMALRFALMQKEYKEDLYGAVFSIDKKKLSQEELQKEIIKNNPFPRVLSMFAQRINPHTIDDLYLVDFALKGDRILGAISQYFKQRYEVYSKAIHARLIGIGDFSLFRLNELVIDI